MKRIVSCFTNSYGAEGVWTAVERIRETGIRHLELALRGHNFGGLVIPESAVVTEKADDATARAFRDHLERARRLVALELDLAETRRQLAEDNLKITEAQLELAERELEEVKAENERLRREIEALRGG